MRSSISTQNRMANTYTIIARYRRRTAKVDDRTSFASISGMYVNNQEQKCRECGRSRSIFNGDCNGLSISVTVSHYRE
ncbi:hypothetical protein OUZ56_014927 [Daphnia magna]|uniref:Uncharacterized protein n=1 Tax=Daphnia magna TaxID=35525 RepID=A0ABR0AL86_9CRUS|nr:hypothetical protein OUZ56_014927 [Daphnia magna]